MGPFRGAAGGGRGRGGGGRGGGGRGGGGRGGGGGGRFNREPEGPPESVVGKKSIGTTTEKFILAFRIGRLPTSVRKSTGVQSDQRHGAVLQRRGLLGE